MQIRTDSVANGSSESFTVIGLDSPMVKKYLEENPIIFTPHPHDHENWAKKFEEQPTKTYSDLNELLNDIAETQDCELGNDDDINIMHFYIPYYKKDEEHIDDCYNKSKLFKKLEAEYYNEEVLEIAFTAWDDYKKENSITEEMLENEEFYDSEYEKFLDVFYANHSYITRDYLKRLSFESLGEFPGYDISDRFSQLAPLRNFIFLNSDAFNKESRCIYANMVVNPGGMSEWVDLSAYIIDKGASVYLSQQYYCPGEWDYNPDCLTKKERQEKICANVEELENFFSKCPKELDKIKDKINQWLKYSWRRNINTFINRETVIKKIKSNSIIFKDIPSQYREDEEILLECIKKAIPKISLPSKIKKSIENNCNISIKSKEEIKDTIAKIKENPSILHDAYRNIYAEKIDKSWAAITRIPEAYRNDKKLVLGALLSYAKKKSISIDDKYRNNINKTLILKLVEHSSVACTNTIISIIPHRYYDDKDIMGMAISKNPFLLDEASVKIKNDKDVVLAAVNQCVEALQYASEELKNDKKFVLTAVKEWGGALEYASEELKNDKKFILSAVKEWAGTFEYASEELKNDKNFVLSAVKMRGYALRYASEELQNDKEVVLTAVKEWGITLQYASEELRNNKKVVLSAVNENGGALEYASEELQNDKEVVLSAVKQHGSALKYASEKLKNDKEVVLTAIENGFYGQYFVENIVKYIPAELMDDKDVAIEAIKHDGESIKYVSERLKKG